MNFLKEASRTPEDLDDSSFVEVTREKSSAVRITLKIGGFVYGNILISRSRDFKPPAGYKMSTTLEGPCAGGFIVRSSLVADGWGPMLYDVAMEIATIEGSGLIPDRNSVSNDAFSVWDYYERKRSDVDNQQLDDPENTLTPIKIDNCNQSSAQLDVGDGDFFKSPLSKIYSKEVNTLIKLKKMGKLKVQGDFSFYSKDNLGESMQDWERKLKNKYGSNISADNFDLDSATDAAVKVIIKSFEDDLERSGVSQKAVDMLILSMPVRIKKDLKNFLRAWLDRNADLEFEDDPEDPDKPSPYSLNLTDKRPATGDWPRATLSKKLEEMKSFLKEGPCWDDYEMVGTKKKDGREVPNCVPKTNEAEEVATPPAPRTVDGDMKQSLDRVIKQKKSQFADEEYDLAPGEIMEFVRKLEERIEAGFSLNEAEFQGREVTLNKPFRDPDVKKKFSVYVKDGDKVKKVNFGDPNMEIKKDNPERRKSFRARHNCDNPGPKTKARYWSCKKW